MRMRAVMPAIMPFLAMVSVALASPEARVLAWAAECAKSPSIEFGWRATQEILTKEGEFADSFEYTIEARFDYPVQMDISTRYELTGHEMDPQWLQMTNKDVRIDGQGNWTETNFSGSVRELGDQFILRDLVKARAYDAPVLLGMWIDEHPSAFRVIDADQSGTIVFEAPEVLSRIILRETGDPQRAWISKLEMIDKAGTLLSWSEFAKPVRIDGTSVRTGSIRTPVSIRRQPTPREGLPSYLEYARAVDLPASAPRSAPASAPGESVAADAASESTPTPGRAFPIWWILGGVCVLSIAAGGLLWTRRAA